MSSWDFWSNRRSFQKGKAALHWCCCIPQELSFPKYYIKQKWLNCDCLAHSLSKLQLLRKRILSKEYLHPKVESSTFSVLCVDQMTDRISSKPFYHQRHKNFWLAWIKISKFCVLSHWWWFLWMVDRYWKVSNYSPLIVLTNTIPHRCKIDQWILNIEKFHR